MKRITTIMMMLVGTVVLQASILSPDEALARALGQKEGQQQTMSREVAERYEHVYTEAEAAYYVFDKSRGGYLVVAGDDEFPALLADVESGSFLTDNLAPGAAWLLGEYAAAIGAKQQAMVPTSMGGLAELYGKWRAVEPLVTTRWNQSWPYNIMCPTKGGQSCVTGCVATALAQLIRTIGYAECSGYMSDSSGDEKVEFDFSAVKFDFDIMPDEPSINDSEEALNAVAQLMLACGLSVHMNYDTDESGAYVENVVPALIDRFGYSAEYTRYVQRAKFTVAQWESMLYRELSIGRPVLYRGQSSTSGHAFVIDGYAPAGRWHVNWGWGGMSDGYFNLSILSPSQQGIGGSTSAEGYNRNQAMVIAVKPGADPGMVAGAVSGGASAGDDGRTVSLFYQSMGNTMLDLSLGAIVTSGDGVSEMGVLTLWEHQSLSASSSIRANNRELDIASLALPAGKYRVYPAFAMAAGSQLQIAESCDGRQYFADLTVAADGTYFFSNATQEAVRAELVVSEVSGGPLHSGYNVGLRVVLVNDGGADFKGDVYADIMKGEDGEVIRRVTAKDVYLSSELNTDIEFLVAGVDMSGIPIAAGQYIVRFTDSEGAGIGNGVWAMDVVTGAPATYQETRTDMSIHNAENIARTMMVGDTWSHVPDAYVAKELRSGDVCVVFYRPGTNVKVGSYTVKRAPISRMNGNMSIDRFAVDVPAGFYEVAYTYARTQVSGRQMVGVGREVDGIRYVPISADEVTVVGSDSQSYEGHVAIPEKVDLDGVTYKVTSIAENAFSNCSELLSVTLPSTVERIGRNGLAYCAGLECMIFQGAKVPFRVRNHAMPGVSESADVYVNADSYDAYREVLSQYHTVYAAIERIESATIELDKDEAEMTLSIEPVHPSINPNFAVAVSADEPSRAASSPTAEVVVKNVKAGEITLGLKAVTVGTTRFVLQSAQRGVSPAEILVTVPTPSAIDGITADAEAEEEEWYDLQGRRISDRETVRRGTVVIIRRNGKGMKMVK